MGEQVFERVPSWLARGGALGVLLIAALVGWLSWSVRPVTLPAAQPAATSAALRAVEARQLRFEPNVGQAPKPVRYLSRGPGHQLAIFDDGMALAVPGQASAQLRFVNARTGGRFDEREPVAARVNYLHGPDAARWVRGVPQLRQLRYAELYRGIDLVYYSRDGELEFDLVVRPGADPAVIQLQASGEKAPFIDADGDLLLDGQGGVLRVHRPVLHQNIDGQRTKLDARWVLGEHGAVSFALPAYDKRYPLVIDPVFKLLYSTYLGGVHDDLVGNLVLDAQGNAYVVGNSGSEDWPVSGNAVQSERQALGRYVRNVVVTKFDAAGTLIWSTFLGGSVNDFGRAIALDATGQVVIAGQTFSSDFPTTADALQRQLQGQANAFIAVLSPDGSTLVRSTLYGGSGGSDATGLAFDPAGRAVVVGAAGTGLSTTAGAYQAALASGQAAFAAKFDLSLAGASQLVAASYYGAALRPAGQNSDNLVYGFALDAAGAPWLTGQAFTAGLPVTADAVMAAPASLTASCLSGSVALNSAAYLARLSADLKTLAYASYLTGRTGGAATCAEFGRGVALDAAGSVYVVGSTSSLAFPTTAGALQATPPGNSGFNGYASFVVKLTPDARTIVWSTYLGGNGGNTFASRIVPDNTANALWVQATTGGGTNFPLSADAMQRQFGGGTYDASYHQLDATTGALKYGTYMGGSGNENAATMALDASGTAYVAGDTDSRNFVVTPTAFQSAYTPNAFDGSDWFFRLLGSGAITRVLPASGGNAGDVTLSISGAGFQPQSVCSLAGAGQTLAATQVAVGADRSTIACTFALTGVAAGVYDIAVVNPDGIRITRSSGFTVKVGTGSDVVVDVLGRSTIRAGTPASFDVVVSNNGDADALGVVLFVRYSAGLKPVDPSLPDPFDLKLIPVSVLFPNDTENYASHSVIVPSKLNPGESMVPLFLPLVAAGSSTTFSFKLVAADESEEEYVEAELSGVLADAEQTLASSQGFSAMRERMLAVATGGRVRTQGLESEACRKALWDYAWDKASGKVPGVDCFRDLQRAIFEAKRYQLTHPANRGSLFSDIAQASFKSATDCAELAGIELAVPIEAAKLYLDLLNDAKAAEAIAEACKDKDKDKKKDKKKKKKTKPKKATDPNDKSGPTGDDSAGHYIKAPVPLGYQIAFENVATAGLPAAEVVVTDQLDASKLDLATLTLGNVRWGSFSVEVPAGLSSYATTVPIDTTMSVRVAGSLNPTTGVLKWTFTTLDPATHLPPSDPTLGFLPPNVNGTQGQGYVNFTVNPKAGLPDGTKWENFASIVFDANAPILTPTWVNTLDTTAPVAHVVSATQKNDSTDVDVAWTGTDTGSGVSRYTVYVADNGGAYTAWQSDVTATAAVFSGTVGHSYAFYVIATDGAGNTEAAKSAAEASVAVRDPAAAGGGGGGGGCTVGTRGQRDASLVLLALAALELLWRRRLSARLGASLQRRARR